MSTDAPNNNASPLLSVVIPTLGRPILIRTLKSLVGLDDFDKLDIIVLGKIQDPAIKKDVLKLTTEHSRICFIEVAFDKGDLSEKKNRGLKESRSSIVAFIDDDLTTPAHWARKIVEPFADPAVAMVCGPSLLPEDVGRMARLSGLTLASKAAGFVSERYTKGANGARESVWSRMIGCNMACRKQALEEIGGFNIHIIPGEDLLVAYEMARKGYKLMFQPEAHVFHYPRQTLGTFCRQAYRFGLARIRLRRAGVKIELVSLLPAVWVFMCMATGLLSVFFRFFLCVFAALGISYMVFVLWATLMVFARTRRFSDTAICFLIPCMHVCYGVGEWIETLCPDRDLAEKHV